MTDSYSKFQNKMLAEWQKEVMAEEEAKALALSRKVRKVAKTLLPKKLVDQCVEFAMQARGEFSDDIRKLMAHRLDKIEHISSENISALAEKLLQSIVGAPPEIHFALGRVIDLPATLSALATIKSALPDVTPPPSQKQSRPTSAEGEALYSLHDYLESNTDSDRKEIAMVIARLFVAADVKPADTNLENYANSIWQRWRKHEGGH